MAADLPRSGVPRWWRAGVTAAVTLVAAALWSGALVQTVVYSSGARVAGIALLSSGLVLLLFRRRAPSLVVASVTALGVVASLIEGSLAGVGLSFALAVALYHLTTTGRPRRSMMLAGASALLIGGAQWYQTGTAGQLVSCVVFIAALEAVCFYIRSRRALLASYRERAEQAVREQQWATAQAVAAERVRIARELHDVIAHHVSLLVVQAGAVRETLPADHLTRPVLDSMIAGGRHAMTELREMLDALRVEDLPLAPQPMIDEIPALVAGARSAGLPVEVVVSGEAQAVSPTTSMAAYRIVQEALTNALKHAPGALTVVRLAWEPGTLDVTVRNRRTLDETGRPASSSPCAGYGIIGMRERATLAHGHLEVGPDAEGWTLHAWLPLDSPEADRPDADRPDADRPEADRPDPGRPALESAGLGAD